MATGDLRSDTSLMSVDFELVSVAVSIHLTKDVKALHFGDLCRADAAEVVDVMDRVSVAFFTFKHVCTKNSYQLLKACRVFVASESEVVEVVSRNLLSFNCLSLDGSVSVRAQRRSLYCCSSDVETERKAVDVVVSVVVNVLHGDLFNDGFTHFA